MKGNIWEFHVKEGCERQFLSMNLFDLQDFFKLSPHYHGTNIAKNLENPCVYVTVDKWDSREDFGRFIRTHKKEYRALDSRHKELYENARHITREGDWFEF